MAQVTITFNLNGGTGTFPTLTKSKNVLFKLPTTIPIRAGYTFSKWKDQLEKVYDKGANYKVGKVNVTLTAQWTAIKYTITYNKGAGTGTVPTQINLTIGSKFILKSPSSLKAPNGKSFTGWKDQSNNIYQPGNQYTVSTTNITLTAQWSKLWSVTYDLVYGSGTIPTQSSLETGSTFIVASADGITHPNPELALQGWKVGEIFYPLGSTYTVGVFDVVFHAVYYLKVTITYDLSVFSGTIPQLLTFDVAANSSIILPSSDGLTSQQYKFTHWVGPDSIQLNPGDSYTIKDEGFPYAMYISAGWEYK